MHTVSSDYDMMLGLEGGGVSAFFPQIICHKQRVIFLLFKDPEKIELFVM